jgi:AraC family transcriptional regulator of adaptative response/methylated-DNA-[protein]-cysteine methyltransferase
MPVTENRRQRTGQGERSEQANCVLPASVLEGHSFLIQARIGTGMPGHACFFIFRFATVHFPRKEALKVFSVNRESAKEKETFRVCVYGREFSEDLSGLEAEKMSKNRVVNAQAAKYNLLTNENKEIDMDTQIELSQHYRLIEQAIRYIEANVQRQPELGEIASAVGLSEYHFQRIFTRWAGISPKRFLQFLTREHAKELLDTSKNLLDATHRIGLSSLGRLHDLFVNTEAVTPGEYKTRGVGLTIRYGIHPTPFGKCLIAATERGVCRLAFVDGSEGGALDRLVEGWKQANMIEDYKSTAPLVTRIFSDPKADSPLSLHLHGTNFQIKVWEALLDIPAGSVTTYERIAAQIGNPKAVRAVGTAVGENPIAYLIPCHRVIRKSGDFGNYMYGSARKKAILVRELGADRNMQVPVSA